MMAAFAGRFASSPVTSTDRPTKRSTARHARKMRTTAQKLLAVLRPRRLTHREIPWREFLTQCEPARLPRGGNGTSPAPRRLTRSAAERRKPWS